jgi:flagellar hook-basal body complex protein FliE
MDVTLSKAAAAYKQANGMDKAGGIGNDTIELNGSDSPKGPAFDDLVVEGLGKARGAGYESEAISTASLANKAELHELVTAVTNAELTLSTVVAVRDRIISAYQDIIKMPI